MAEKLEVLKDEGGYVGWVEGEQGLAERSETTQLRRWPAGNKKE